MLQPIDADQVNQTAQMLLNYLDDPSNSTPNDMVEGIASAKGLMRGILAGNLVLCAIPPNVTTSASTKKRVRKKKPS